MSISRRILVTALVGVVPLVAVGIFAAREASLAVRDEMHRGLWNIADLEQVKVEGVLATTTSRLVDLFERDRGAAEGPEGRVADLLARLDRAAEGSDAQAALRQELGARLALVVSARPDIGAVSLFDRAGRPVAVHSEPGRPTPRPIPPGLVEAAQVRNRVGAAFRGVDGVERYQQAVPVSVAGDTVGVAVVECDLGPVSQLLEDDSGLGRSAEAHLVQRTPEGGAEFISALRFDPGATFSKVIPPTAVNTPAIRALSRGPGGEEGLRDYRQEEVIAAYRRIAGTDWALVVKIDRAEAYAPVRRITRTLLVVAVGSGALLAAAAVVLARSTMRRIRKLTATAEAISAGDLTHRVGDRTDDELGRLATAFDRMAAHLDADLAERARIEARLLHQTRHDALTGLSGRGVAQERLAHALGELRGSERVGLLFCDLDSFKAVNDELGHSAGDELLVQVASRLRRAVDPDHVLARFGGDEFVVVLARVRDEAEVEAAADRLKAALDEPFVVAEHRIVVTMSVGSVLVDAADGASPESMVRDADSAMYRAKDLGRDRHVAVDEEIRLRASTGMTAVMNLRRAIHEDQLVVHYQPIVDVGGGAVTAVEALVRWPDAHGQARLSPGALVALAERSGLGAALDEWVVRTAATQLRRWRDAGLVDLRLAVNLSAAKVADPHLLGWFGRTVEACGVPYDRLDVEVTEMAFRDDERAIVNLGQLRRHGVRVAVDDFGTGFSSLDRLHRLPVDVLKMDQAFVRHLDADRSLRSISALIVGLGRSLGLEVVAEGVERRGQLDVVAELGCTSAQGFLFAAAQPPGRIEAVVRRGFDLAPAPEIEVVTARR